MRGVVLGFWTAYIGWGWMTYPTGKVENMDAAGGIFIVLGTLILLYSLLFNNLIPVGAVRSGVSLFYIAWGWNWAFWRLDPTGNYLDLQISAYTISVESILILVGCALCIYGTYTYIRNPLRPPVQEVYENISTMLTWENIQLGLGKLMGLSLGVVFLLFGFFYMSHFLETPYLNHNLQYRFGIFWIFVSTFLLHLLAYNINFAEERKRVPALTAGMYILSLGMGFLIIPEGEILLGILLGFSGVLIIKNWHDLNAKNYIPGKGKLAGIGCLFAGLCDFLYVPKGATQFTMLTPSLQGGLFMGHRFLEGIALIGVFVVLIILPTLKVTMKTLKLSFLAPLILYGVSLVVLSSRGVNFTTEQMYSIYWTRGVQLSFVVGILILSYCTINFVYLFYIKQRAIK